MFKRSAEGSTGWRWLRSCVGRAVLAFWIGLFLPVQAQPAPVPILIDESDAPFMYVENGKMMGVYPVLLRAAFARLGVPIEIRAMPWKRALLEADLGRAGVAGIYKTAEREKKYDYSEVFYAERLVLYFRAGRPLPPFTSVKDLKGMTVGTHRGWSYGDAFDAAAKAGWFKTEEVNADIQNFMKLERGRIDCLIVSAIPGAVIAPQYRVQLHPTPLSEGLTYLIFPKQMNLAGLLARFDQVMLEMKDSGTLQQLVESVLK